MRSRALHLTAIALTAILTAAACGGPDAAEVAVDEFCDELKYLIREYRLERVDGHQFSKANLDLVVSLANSEERTGRRLIPIAETKCPTAWNDSERIREEITQTAEARLAELQQEKAKLEQGSQTDNATVSPKDDGFSPSPAVTIAPNVSKHTIADTPTPIESSAKATGTAAPILDTVISSLKLPGPEQSERILFYTNLYDDKQRGLYVLSTISGEASKLDLNVTKNNTDKVEEITFWGEGFDLSRNKRYLAVSRGPIIDDENDRNKKGLFIIDLQNHTIGRLSNPPENCNDTHPLWSSNNNALLFEEICEGSGGGIRQLGVIDVAQGTRTYIKDIEKGINISRYDFEFSSDGNTIIGFISYTHDGTLDGTIMRSIMTYNLTDSRWQEVPYNDSNSILADELAQLKLNSEISPLISVASHNMVGDRSLGGVFFDEHGLSPDGDLLAVHGSIVDFNQDFRKDFVSILDVHTGTIEKLISPDSDESGIGSHRFDGRPSWSPDGRFIALKVDQEPDGVYHAYIIDVESESIRPLSSDDDARFWGVTLGDIVWSRDSSHILIGACASNCDRGDFENSIRVVNVSSGEYRRFFPDTEGQIYGLQWLSEADQEPPTTTPTRIASPTPAETTTRTATSTSLPSTMDGKSVDELRAIVHDEFGKIALSLAEVFVHYDSEKQRPLAIESMLDAIDSCLLSKEAIDQLGVVDSSYELWPKVAANVSRYCDHLTAASESLIDWNLIKFTQSIANAMSALDDAAADVPRL